MTSTLKTFVLLISALLISTSSLAAAGESSSGTRGGGDPEAAEFLKVLIDLNAYLVRSNSVFSPNKKEAAKDLVEKFQTLMDEANQTPIQFTSDKLHDDSGAEKFALYSTKPLRILVNRPAWLNGSEDFKYRLVALEFFGLLGVKDRYTEAANLDVFLIKETKRILNSSWSFSYIHRVDGTVAIENPGASSVLEPSGQRPIVTADSKFSDLTLEVLCRLFGYPEFVHAFHQPLSPAYQGSATVYDADANMKTQMSLEQPASKYVRLESILCGYPGAVKN